MNRAVYPGTFDPPTAGHLSVVKRTARLFDDLVVLLAVNPQKVPTFSVAERIAMLREALAGISGVTVDATEGLVLDFSRKVGAGFLVRGVRGTTDFDFEMSMASAHLALAPELVTLFVPADPELSFVSSSALRELARCGGDVSRFCPPSVARRLAERFGRGKAAAHAV
jgi:pantetheine-phosphate adenylyltransferase